MNDDLPVAVSGTRRALRELSDGTVRVQVDIDPRFREAFFTLFSQIDCGILMTPMSARAAPPKPSTSHDSGWVVDTEKLDAVVQPPLKIIEETGTANKPKFPKGLAGLAVRWASDDHHCAWLSQEFPGEWADAVARLGSEAGDAALAKQTVCTVCHISSRKVLDAEPSAGDVFRHRILEPYAQQRKDDGVDDEQN